MKKELPLRELKFIRDNLDAAPIKSIATIGREEGIAIIDELIAARQELSELRQLTWTPISQLKVVRDLNDILRRHVAHYRDRHPHPLGACPECKD